jgi:REP element-mobilizing transposase RayT
MPSKYLQRVFLPDTQHHVFNRGAFKFEILRDEEDLWTFRGILKTTQREQLFAVEFKTYALIPNHFHLRLLQREERSVSYFMHNAATKYAMYHREKYDHSGRFCEGPYKSRYLKTVQDQRRTHRYILNNPVLAGLPSDWKHVGIKP